MPINAPDIPVLNAISAERVLLLDSTSGDLALFPVTNFRGAGFYTGTALPTEIHPDDATGGVYQAGDFYVYTDGQSNTLYMWDITQAGPNRWVERGSLTGTRRHTAVSLGTDDYELEVLNINAPNVFAAGDTYYSVARNKTFGPHIPTVGIDFNVENRQYISGRNAQQLRHNDANPAKHLHTWTPSDITDVEDPAYAPQRGDTYLQGTVLVDGENAHGGYIFTWDEDTFQASITNGDTYDVAFNLGWNTNPKVFAREPRIFSESQAPTNNDLKFIDGDSFFDTNSLRMWRGYVTGLVRDELGVETDEEFLIRTWGGELPQQLAPNRIVELQGDMVLPDESVADGDFILNNRFNTPAFYGPYNHLDVENLPFIANMRGSHTFIENVEPDNTQATLRLLGWMAIVGDKYIHDYGTGRRDTYNCTAVTETLVTWTLDTTDDTITTHELPTRTLDDTIYKDGDYGIWQGVIWGPYVEGSLTDAVAWPYFNNLRGVRSFEENNTHQDINLTDAEVANPDATMLVGDNIILTHPVTFKRSPYRITAVDYTDQTYPYTAVRTPYEVLGRTHYVDTQFTPARDDTLYQEGDFAYNTTGNRYGPYTEGAITDQTAWPLIGLAGTPVVEDDTTAATYTLRANNGFLYLEEQ